MRRSMAALPPARNPMPIVCSVTTTGNTKVHSMDSPRTQLASSLPSTKAKNESTVSPRGMRAPKDATEWTIVYRKPGFKLLGRVAKHSARITQPEPPALRLAQPDKGKAFLRIRFPDADIACFRYACLDGSTFLMKAHLRGRHDEAPRYGMHRQNHH